MGKRLEPELATARRVRCRQAVSDEIERRDAILKDAQEREVSEEKRTKAHEAIQAMVDACTSGGSQNTHASIVNRYIAYCKTNQVSPFPMVPGVVALFFHDEMGNLANWDPTLSILNKMRKNIENIFSEEYPDILVAYKDTASPLQRLYGMGKIDKPKQAKGKGKGKAVVQDTDDEETAVAQELTAPVEPTSIDDLLTHRAHYMDAIKTIKTPDEEDVKAIRVCEVYIKTLESDKGRKAHHNYLKRFRTWCKDKETPVFPIHPAAIALFLADRCTKFDWHTICLMFEHFRKETLPLFTNEHPWVTTGLREDVTLAAFLAAPRKKPLAVRRRPGKPSAKDLVVDEDGEEGAENPKEADVEPEATPAPATPSTSARPNKALPDELPIVFTSIPHLLTRTYVSDLVAVFGRDEIKPQDGRKNIVSKCAQRLESDPAVRTQLERVVNERLMAAKAKQLADKPPEVYAFTPAASTSTAPAADGTPAYLDPTLADGEAGRKRARVEDGDVEVPEKRQKV